MDKYIPIWTEIRQFLYIVAMFGLMWTWVDNIRSDVTALQGGLEESVRIARQVEYLLSTQGYVSAPLDPGQASPTPQSGFPSPAP